MNNKIKIRKGNDIQEPTVVYVTGMSSHGDLWVTYKLNEIGTILLSADENLIDFDFKTFNKMYYEWKIKNHEATKQRMEELLKSYS